MLIDQKTIVGDIYRGVDQVAIVDPPAVVMGLLGRHQAADLRREGRSSAPQPNWAGRDTNRDGILDKDGKPLTVTLATHSEDPNRVQTIEFMQAIFKEAGIDAQGADHRLAVLLHQLRPEEPAPDRAARLAQHRRSRSAAVLASSRRADRLNWGGYSNPEVDKLLQEGRSALDEASADDRLPEGGNDPRRRSCPTTSCRTRAISSSTRRSCRSRFRRHRAAICAG